jgi:hypothetical protein
MLIDLGDLKGNDLTGIAVCASDRETTWENDPMSSSGQRLFERLIDGMQLTARGQPEPVLKSPHEECRGPTAPDVGVFLFEQAQLFRDNLDRRVQVSGGRKVLPQCQDIGRPGVGVVEAHGQALDRPDVVLANLGNLGFDLQNYNIETIRRPAFHE